jgi:Tfp pilus assembly protein PilX
MKPHTHTRQHGAALVTALLILLILAIIGITGMSDSIFDLRMAGNIQSYYNSLQQSESGIAAAISQGSSFTSSDQSDIFATGGSNPLKDYIKPTVGVDFLYENQYNSPSQKAHSVDSFLQETYIFDSNHADSATGANTHIHQGVVRMTLKL